MIRFAVEQWDRNKDDLRNHFSERLHLYESCDYIDIVKVVVEYIYNDCGEDSKIPEYLRWKFDANSISEINNGDYQGTVLYVIPRDTYQPSAGEYLLTHTHYGSCGGCDALLDVQYTIEKAMNRYRFEDLTEKEKKEHKESVVKDLMSLSLHLVQNTIRPYNKGWEKSEHFDDIEYNHASGNDDNSSGDTELRF